MWFKQVQVFQLTTPIKHSTQTMIERLEALEFKACLPSMPSSTGWVSPVDEENAALVRTLNGCHMICLQTEEKILPASVVNQALKDKLKEIETSEARKIRGKEKLSYKDEVIHTLLTRAFTKLSRMYAYIDTKNNWLIINNNSPAKTEMFLSMFKKSLGDVVEKFDVIKPAAILTQWLKDHTYPKIFSIEKSCVLQDPNQQNRVIRCQQQDLFAPSIQTLAKEGCEVIQLGLCWQDRISFVMAGDFTLRSVRRTEDDLAEITEITESKSQRLDAYFFMMTETFGMMLKDLLELFVSKDKAKAAA